MNRSRYLPPGLFQALFRLDEISAAEARASGCGHCQGPVHRSDYERKPRGVPGVEDERRHRRRISFCCAVEGCRRRATPFSVRFLGRKVYFAAVVLLVSALRHGPESRPAERLSEVFGPSLKTVWRWRRWWLDEVARSAPWRARRRLVPEAAAGELPHSVLERLGFGEDPPGALLKGLEFFVWLSSTTDPREPAV